MTSEFEDLEQALIMANKVNLAGAPGGTKAEALRDLGRMRNMFDALEAPSVPGREPRAPGTTSASPAPRRHDRGHGEETPARSR